MSLLPLGMAVELAESVGFGITHAWEDLAFGEHGVFILQLGAEGTATKLYFNRDLDRDERKRLTERFTEIASERSFSLAIAGSFELTQKEGKEEVDIAFFVPEVSV